MPSKEGSGSNKGGKSDCDGKEIHKNTEHNFVEKVAEWAVPNLQKHHENELKKGCDDDRRKELLPKK